MEALSLRNTGFVPLADGETGPRCYGGKQAWFTKKSQRLRGCGPVAAANILCYLAASDKKYRPLYPELELDRPHFLELMSDMYAALSPRTLGGVFTCKRFIRGVTRWAKSRGVPLTAHAAGPRTHDREEAMSVILQGLRRNKPVAALNLKLRYTVPPGGENFGWHWVTVTGVRPGPDGRIQIAASSWGRIFYLDWDGYWQACSRALLPGGFIWLE